MLNYKAENAPYGYFVLNHDGLIRDVNATFLHWLGYEYDEVINTNIESLLSIANKMMFHTLFFLQLQLNGRVDEVNLTVRSKSGQAIPVMLMGHREDGCDEELLRCIAIKMAKRYDYEKELRDIKVELEEAYKSKNAALEEVKNSRDELLKFAAQIPGMLYQYEITPDGNVRVPFSTAAIKDLFDCTPEEVRDDFSLVAKVIHPDDVNRMNAAIAESVKNLSPFQFEYRVLLPGQPVRWILAQAMPEKKADGTIVFHGFNADVTDRKQMEDLLIKERELFNTTLMSVDEGIIMATISGEILVFNAGAERITGYLQAEVLHRSVYDLFPLTNVQTGESVNEYIMDMLQMEKRLDTVTDFALIAKDGTEKRIAISIARIKGAQGEEDRIIASFRDISREYELEKQIQGFLDVNLDMLCVADLDTNFHRVNKKFEEVLGYSEEELVGKDFLSFIHEDDIKDTLAALKDLANNKKVSGFINRYRCKDGSYKYIEWQSQLSGGNFTYSSARDVTEKKKQEEERLKISENKYRFVAEHISDVVWVMNLSKGEYTYVSPSILHQTGFTVEESMTQRMEDALPPESIATTRGVIARGREYLEKYPDSSYHSVTEMQKICKSGELIWVEATTDIMYNSQGDIEIIGTSRNIEERKQIEKLRQLSYHDQLTGLYNRQFFNTIIDDEMTRSENYEQKLTLCIMDLDHFKHVNDTWGHPVGDELLKLTAKTALEHKRNTDLLFRFGGEEFVMLMPGTNLDGAIVSLEKIREAIASMNHPVTGKQTISIGIAERMKHESFFDWYKRADEALYRAKRGGRNRVEVSA